LIAKKTKLYLQRGNGYRASSSLYRIRRHTEKNESPKKKKKQKNWKLRIGK